MPREGIGRRPRRLSLLSWCGLTLPMVELTGQQVCRARAPRVSIDQCQAPSASGGGNLCAKPWQCVQGQPFALRAGLLYSQTGPDAKRIAPLRVDSARLLSELCRLARASCLTSRQLASCFCVALLGVSGPISFLGRAVGLTRGCCGSCRRLIASVIAVPIASGDLPPAPSMLAQCVSNGRSHC